MVHTAIILLGTNIQPVENMRRAVELLRERCTLLDVSHVWETEAVGSPGPNFLNAAVRLITQLESSDLKAQVLDAIEKQLGRVRTADKYAPRTIDLDIILFDGNVLDDNLWKRAFAALPVVELAPEIHHPQSGESLSAIAERLHREQTAMQREGIFF